MKRDTVLFWLSIAALFAMLFIGAALVTLAVLIIVGVPPT